MSHDASSRAALVLAAALLGASAVRAQSTADLVGLTALKQRLGAANAPTGLGVIAGQCEAPAPGYAPDPSVPELAGKSYTYESGPVSYSGHATAVAQYFYGTQTSLAPAIGDVHCYEATDWIGVGFLMGTGSTPPKLAAWKVLNNSWIGSGSVMTLRKLDHTIETQGLVVITAVNNGAGALDLPLLSHSFNGLCIGRSDGQHRAGGTLAGYDKSGRMKPEIVAPAGATSFAAPLISGAASLLVETARTWPSLAGNPDAQRPEVVKAALLAGAEHRAGWSNGAPTSGAARGSTLTPLDALWGCDEVDVNHAHWILTAGEQPSAGSPAAAPTVAPQGWSRATTSSAASAWWRFEVEQPKAFVSVLATWNRKLAANFGSFTIPDHDLELWSVDATGALVSLVGNGGLARFSSGNVLSASTKDNLEHLYLRDLAPGSYALELRRSSDTLAAWDVAVAWEFGCAEPTAYGSGKTTSLGAEARLAHRGIPSLAANDFHLVVSNALPSTNGIAFWGAAPASAPFHGGTRWVSTPIVRMALAATDASGALDVPVPIDASMPGTSRCYQFWFRDPAHPDGTHVGLTNGVQVSFCR